MWHVGFCDLWWRTKLMDLVFWDHVVNLSWNHRKILWIKRVLNLWYNYFIFFAMIRGLDSGVSASEFVFVFSFLIYFSNLGHFSAFDWYLLHVILFFSFLNEVNQWFLIFELNLCSELFWFLFALGNVFIEILYDVMAFWSHFSYSMHWFIIGISVWSCGCFYLPNWFHFIFCCWYPLC